MTRDPLSVTVRHCCRCIGLPISRYIETRFAYDRPTFIGATDVTRKRPLMRGAAVPARPMRSLAAMARLADRVDPVPNAAGDGFQSR